MFRGRPEQGRRRSVRIAAASAAAAALSLSGLIAAAAPASAAPKGTAALSKQVGLTDGESVTLTLTNYPVGAIKVEQCTVSASSAMTPGICVEAVTPVTVVEKDTTPGRGDATTAVVVKRTFSPATGVTVDCDVAWCGIRTSAVDPLMVDAADADVRALPLSFRSPTLAYDAPDGISRSAETPVTVTGTGFRTGSKMRVFQCKGVASVQANCDASKFVSSSEADAAGNLVLPTVDGVVTKLNVRPVIKVGGVDYDCTASGNSCSLQTSSQTAGADTTQQSSVALHFGPELRVSKSTDLAYAGESITVSGVQYAPNKALFVSQCDVNVPGGDQCNHTLSDVLAVTTSATGTFSASMTVKGSFDGNAPVDCNAAGTQCGLQSVTPEDFADRSQDATVTIGFSAKVPPAGPSLTLSKSTVKVGDTVTLTGKDYPKTAKSLYVSICADPPSATNCDMNLANIGQIDYDGAGGFTSTYKVKALKFTTGDGVIDCSKVQCVIGTTNAVKPSDRSYNATARITADTTAPAAKAPGKATKVKVVVKRQGRIAVVTWAKAKANGTPVTKYVVKVKKGKKAWKKAGTTKASVTKLVWKKGKPGTYKAKVIARSAAGASESRTVKFALTR